MAGSIKVKYKHTLPIILHADMMDDFKKAINKDIGVYFREIQEEVVERYRQEKKESPPSKGAVNYIESDSYKVLSKKKQISLDVFAKDYEELNEKERTQFRIQYMNLGKQIEMIHVNENSKISKFKRLPY